MIYIFHKNEARIYHKKFLFIKKMFLNGVIFYSVYVCIVIQTLTKTIYIAKKDVLEFYIKNFLKHSQKQIMQLKKEKKSEFTKIEKHFF